jgi:hypothetical protein
MGDTVGGVYTCPECACPMVGESFPGELDGNAASSNGANIERAEPGVAGMATLDRLLLLDWKIMLSPR